MLNTLIETMKTALLRAGASPVYSAFDAVRTDRKEKGIYTIVGVDSFESFTPVYTPYVAYLPFRADVSVKITAPPDMPLETLYDYYSGKVADAFDEFMGLTSSLKKLTVKFDSNIGRLVLSAVLSTGGVTRIERGEI